MNIRVVLFLCLSIFVAAHSHGEIGIGDARDDVLRQLGKPTSIARRGDHEIFLYPKGGRIEFVGGKVTDVKGPLPPAIVVPPNAAPTPPPVTEPAKEEPKPAPVTPAPSAKKTPPANSVPARRDFNPAVMSEELAKQVEKMETPWRETAPEQQGRHSPLDSLPEFFTGLALRFVCTVIALKLAFKYWEMDAFWRGVFMIAGIDLTLHAILELLGPASGGFTTMVGVENGIPGLVLIFTINRFCFNKRIQNAVITAAAVKLVVALLYIFAGIAAVNLIYG